MVFSNPWFFAFLAVTLLALAPPFSVAVKKRILAAASCLFYAAWDWRYLGLLLFISVFDWFCADQIARPGTRRRLWVAASITSNLTVLGWFKYTNFFLDNLNGLFSVVAAPPLPHLDILLPAGISFYTFKTMSYVIDVYRRQLPPVRTFWDYVTFITFFPELIAGPIVRASVLLPQLDRAIGPTLPRLRQGGSIFLLGFTQKQIADHLAGAVDPVFAAPASFDAHSLWAALLAYTLQIYCDFAGYSLMAIGCAKMIGYDLPENFRMPYLSGNITEFWRRWHITLSSWLRDYLYIPLGGNRLGTARTYANLMATMLLGGLWHGASWNFVVWGALHGGALAVHRAWTAATAGRFRIPTAIAIPLTFAFVSIAWVPFRSQHFDATLAYFHGLFAFQDGIHWVSAELPMIVVIVTAAHLVGAALASPAWRASLLPRLAALSVRLVDDPLSGRVIELGLRSAAGVFVVVFWSLLAYLTAMTDSNPFIYFQF